MILNARSVRGVRINGFRDPGLKASVSVET